MADLYPIAIIEDRYRGVYAGGAWLAIAEADARIDGDGPSRIRYALTAGPHGDDTDAMMFWADPPNWIAVGGTPDTALAALRAKAA